MKSGAFPDCQAQRSRDEEWPDLLPMSAYVNLRQARELDKLKCLIPTNEVAINLDQNVTHSSSHWGIFMPVVLASVSHLWGIMKGRPYTAEDFNHVTPLLVLEWSSKG